MQREGGLDAFFWSLLAAPTLGHPSKASIVYDTEAIAAASVAARRVHEVFVGVLASLEFCPEDAEELERWGMYAHQMDRVGFQVAPRSVGRTDSNRTRASSTACSTLGKLDWPPDQGVLDLVQHGNGKCNARLCSFVLSCCR